MFTPFTVLKSITLLFVYLMIDTWRLKKFLSLQSQSNRPEDSASKWAGSARVTQGVIAAAWALGTVKSTDGWCFPFVSFSYT